MTSSAIVFNPKAFLGTLTNQPGVYCMLDHTGTVLYVGKARNLKKRIASYFTLSTPQPKTRALVAQIANIEVIVTPTENEALILENTLIKTHQPHYNFLLRDDKSYPYLFVSDHAFPRLDWHRGTKTAKGRYFGPYPHRHAAHETLNLLQKIFLIRQCKESVFRHRSRPCLQYQIKRCFAPCVDLIDQASYQENVQYVTWFLEGKSQAIIATLVDKMEVAAQNLEFEQAARYRDQIRHLRKIQQPQYVSTEKGNIDIIVSVIQNGMGCVQVLTVRDGQQVGNRAFFPQTGKVEVTDAATLLSAFLPQYYLVPDRDIPDEIVLNQDIENKIPLIAVLKQQRGRSVRIHSGVRGTRAHWVKMALDNAYNNLAQQHPNQYQERLTVLSLIFNLETRPQRLECFDISHTQGEATVASCVVFDSDGPCYSAYRRFNIKNITPGDDYAALQQALMQRYSGLPTEAVLLPDILFIDGGVGQVKVAQTVLTKLQLTQIRIIGIAKGAHRQPGLESLIFPDTKMPLKLPKNSPAQHLIQQIRDEAHRFALTSHRRQRAKVRRTSALEQIEGIGPQRRQRLIRYFGGLQGVSRASVEDLARVPGIDRQLAERIYNFFLNEQTLESH